MSTTLTQEEIDKLLQSRAKYLESTRKANKKYRENNKEYFQEYYKKYYQAKKDDEEFKKKTRERARIQYQKKKEATNISIL
jgi:F0F1-type ATP synthase membrane subunit b/b'